MGQKAPKHKHNRDGLVYKTGTAKKGKIITECTCGKVMKREKVGKNG